MEFEIGKDEQKVMDQLAAKLNPATVAKNKETPQIKSENSGAADAFDFEERKSQEGQ